MERALKVQNESSQSPLDYSLRFIKSLLRYLNKSIKWTNEMSDDIKSNLNEGLRVFRSLRNQCPIAEIVTK